MKALFHGLLVLICLSASTGFAASLEEKKSLLKNLNTAVRDLRLATAISISQSGKPDTDRQERLVQAMKMCDLQQPTRAKGDFTFSGELCPIKLQHTTLRYEYGRNQNGDPYEHKQSEQTVDVLNQTFANLTGIANLKDSQTEVDDTLVLTPVEKHSWKKKIVLTLVSGDEVTISGETVEYTNMENDQKTLKAAYKVKWVSVEDTDFVLNISLKQTITQEVEETQESTIDGSAVHPSEIHDLLSSVL